MRKMKKIDIAVVGVGAIGTTHARHAENLGNLLAVCDVKKEQMQGYHCNKYPSLDELLQHETPDLVAICTPNSFHADQSILALNHGCHVLCEKPMALTVDDCERMIHASERNNRRLFVVKQNRFNSPCMGVKKALDDGALGRILDVQVNCFWNRNNYYYSESDWHGTEKDGGVLYTQFSHFIDLLLWYVGDIRTVSSFMGSFLHGFSDTGVVAFKTWSGTVGSINFTINSYKRNMEGSITLFGEKGTVRIGGRYLNKLEYQCIDNYEIIAPEDMLAPNIYGTNRGTGSNHVKVYRNVIDVLNGNGSIVTDMLDGLKTVELIRRIYDSA